jgi:hypothetical protein
MVGATGLIFIIITPILWMPLSVVSSSWRTWRPGSPIHSASGISVTKTVLTIRGKVKNPLASNGILYWYVQSDSLDSEVALKGCSTTS